MTDVRSNRTCGKRIDYEIVVDGGTPEERARSSYYYRDEKVSFPFAARCIVARSVSPLRKGE